MVGHRVWRAGIMAGLASALAACGNPLAANTPPAGPELRVQQRGGAITISRGGALPGGHWRSPQTFNPGTGTQAGFAGGAPDYYGYGAGINQGNVTNQQAGIWGGGYGGINQGNVTNQTASGGGGGSIYQSNVTNQQATNVSSSGSWDF